ncbi:MAG: cysteine--tRNA ligase [Phycisphaerales bacterium]
MPLRLYNSLTKQIEPFIPADPSRVTFYSCGPTVYDDAHIGNFRSFLAADVLRRWIESPLCDLSTDASDPDNPGKIHKASAGRVVNHIMNITDVGHMTDDAEGGEAGEDRMVVAGRRIAEAKKAGKIPVGVDINPTDPYAVARFYEDRFLEDARKLGLKLALEAAADPAKRLPRATENIPGMQRIIEKLMQRGYAYVAGSPGSRVVYFDVQKFGRYGCLSGNTLDKLREGAGGRISDQNQSQKRHPADFLLWKEDPSHIMKWDSPWGKGYPGWHIECSAMSISRLVPGVGADMNLTVPDGRAIIDLHSGGEDNIFPHHECEVAQSCAAFNAVPDQGSFAAMWFHARFLFVEGQKMSKSKGNFFTARDLFAKGYEPAAVRLELIRTHYRSNANFTEQGLKDSQRIIERWRKVQDAGASSGAVASAHVPVLAEFTAAMQDDLNIASAIGLINSWINGLAAPTKADTDAMRIMDGVLGVLSLERPAAAQTSIGVFMDGLAPDPAVIAKLHERAAARTNKDFKRSDAIRDELSSMGYAIKDIAGGKVEVRRA